MIQATYIIIIYLLNIQNVLSVSALVSNVTSILSSAALYSLNSSAYNDRSPKMSSHFQPMTSNDIEDIYEISSQITSSTENPRKEIFSYQDPFKISVNKKHSSVYEPTNTLGYAETQNIRKFNSEMKHYKDKRKKNSNGLLQNMQLNNQQSQPLNSPSRNIINDDYHYYNDHDYQSSKAVMTYPEPIYKAKYNNYDNDDDADIIDELLGEEMSPRYSVNENYEGPDFNDHQPYHSVHGDFITKSHFHPHKHRYHHRPTYHHHPHHHTVYYTVPDYHHETDFSKFGLLAVAKIIIAKIKAVGFFKILLLLAAKFPLILLKLAIKFFFIFKVIKFFKFLTMASLIPLIILPFVFLLPIFLVPMAPLAFLPLLIPLLLPLLLLLPVPVIGPANQPSIGKRRKKRSESISEDSRGWPHPISSYDFLILTRRVLESQNCLERLSCNLASKQRSSFYNNTIIWCLAKLQLIIPQALKPRIVSYTEAYKSGMTNGMSGCNDTYKCAKSELYIPPGSLIYQLI